MPKWLKTASALVVATSAIATIWQSGYAESIVLAALYLFIALLVVAAALSSVDALNGRGNSDFSE
jgi:hypothetical protein